MNLFSGYALVILPIITIISILICCITKTILLKKYVISRWTFLKMIYFSVSIISILFATLGTLLNGIHLVERNQRQLNLLPFSFLCRQNNQSDLEYYWSIKQFIMNILLFIPWGSSFSILFESSTSVKSLWLITLSIGAIIESVQYYVGRVADIDDLFAYLLGSIFGLILHKIILILHKKWIHTHL